MDFDETAAWFEQRNLRFMLPEQRGGVWVAGYQHRSSRSGEWWFAADSPEAAAEAARDNAEVVLRLRTKKAPLRHEFMVEFPCASHLESFGRKVEDLGRSYGLEQGEEHWIIVATIVDVEHRRRYGPDSDSVRDT
jgi:hypothetical protein